MLSQTYDHIARSMTRKSSLLRERQSLSGACFPIAESIAARNSGKVAIWRGRVDRPPEIHSDGGNFNSSQGQLKFMLPLPCRGSRSRLQEATDCFQLGPLHCRQRDN